MATLVTAEGYEDVYAQYDADLYYGLSGGGRLETGGKMAYSIPDANVVRIADGMLITEEGRTIIIPVGSYDDFQIPVGATGVTSYYILGYRLYTNGSNVRVAEQFVYTASSATDVPQNSGTLRDGAIQYYVSVYRVKQVGLTIDTVTPLIGILHPLAYISTLETALNTAANTAKNYTDAQHLHPGRTDVLTPQCFGFISNSKKTIDVMVPLKKTLGSDVSGIRVYSLYATVRQTGPGYLYGAAGTPKAIDPAHCTVYDTRGGLRLVWTESKAINDKAINNGLVSMDVQLRLTLT